MRLVFLEKFDQFIGGGKSLITGHGHPFKKEIQPGLPIALFAGSLEQVIIEAAMAFEK